MQDIFPIGSQSGHSNIRINRKIALKQLDARVSYLENVCIGDIVNKRGVDRRQCTDGALAFQRAVLL